ncbi:MAG: type IV secretion system protein [Methylotenera sp.]
MKKKFSAVVLVAYLLSASNANATGIPVVDALKNAFDIAYKAAEDAWKEAKDAWEESEWGKQWNQLQAQIKEAQEIKQQFSDMTSGLRGIASSFDPKDVLSANAKDTIDYRYADQLPEKYLPSIKCSETGTGCIVVGTGYAGKAIQTNSANIRNALRLDPASVGYDPITGIGKSIQRISNEAAEKNAQEIAVIQGMASEAYVEANNRIKKLDELQTEIGKDSAKNDLKRMADLQAQIQAQQAYLDNEQSKLAALAILQQSQRDSYEQRKKEIAAYVKTGDRDLNPVQELERAAVGVATTAAYAGVKALYTVY